MCSKKSYISLLFLCFSIVLSAQNYKRDWTVNIGVGYGTYFGDLSHYKINSLSDWRNTRYFLNPNSNYIQKPSFHLSFQKRVSEKSSLVFSGNLTNVMMSDRYMDADGSLRVESPNFRRALNFESEIYDVGLAYKMRSSSDAFISTFLLLGGGVSYFSSYGNLFNENGNRYNYSQTSVAMDDSYETNLRDQLTETDTRYRNIVPYANLGLGIDVKLSTDFAIGIETDIKYSFSDYIDDVSGTYRNSYPNSTAAYIARPGTNLINPNTLQRGNNDGVNDFYIQNRLVLRYRFSSGKDRKTGAGRNSFEGPPIYPAFYKSLPRDSSAVQSDSSRTALRDANIDTTETSKVNTEPGTASVIVSDSIYGMKKIKPVDTLMGNRQELQQMLEKRNDRSLEIRIDSLQERIRILERKPMQDMFQGRLDSVDRRLQQLKRKARPTTEDRLRMQVYRLQLDSISSDANNRGFQLNNSSSYPANQSIIETSATTILVDSASITGDTTAVIESKQSQDPIIIARNIDTSSVLNIQSRKNDWQRQIDSLERIRRRYNPMQTDTVSAKKIRALEQKFDSLQVSIRDSSDNYVSRDSTLTQSNSADRMNQPVMDSDDNGEEQLEKRIDSLERALRQKPVPTMMVEKDTILQTKTVTIRDTVTQAKIQNLEKQIEKLLAENDTLRNEPEMMEAMYRTNQARIINDSLRLLALRNQEENYASRINEKEAELKWYNRVLNTRNQREISDLQQQQEQLNYQTANLIEEMNRLRSSNNALRNQLDNRPVDTRRSGINNRDVANLYEEIKAIQNQLGYRNNPAPVVAVSDPFPQNASYALQDEIYELRKELMLIRAERDSNTSKNMQSVSNSNELMRDSLAKVSAMIDSLRKQMQSMATTRNNETTDTVVTSRTDARPVLSKVPVSIYFNLGSSTASDEQLRRLHPLNTALENPENLEVSLNAYTDATGNKKVNEALAIKRANSVRDYLVRVYGLRKEQFAVLINTNDTGTGNKPNPLDRRVDVLLRYNVAGD